MFEEAFLMLFNNGKTISNWYFLLTLTKRSLYLKHFTDK